MMNVLRNKLFLTAAITTMCAAINPGTLSAQTSGVGSDGYTRVLWKATDSSISLWRLDANLGFQFNHLYGPYDGWLPIAITTGYDNYTRVLWRATDGTISLWLVDPNLNFVFNRIYGPYYGWTAESISIDSFNRLRLIWKETSGEISVWELDANLNYLNSRAYGPYFGYDPSSAAVKSQTDQSSAAKDAPAEMNRAVVPPVPQQ